MKMQPFFYLLFRKKEHRHYADAFLCFVLIGDAGGAIVNVDDAAAFKTVIQNQLLHYMVIFMGVDAQVGDNGFAVIQRRIENAAAGAVAADAMDGAVGSFVFPCAVFDVAVGVIFAQNKGEYAVDAVVFTNIALPFGNVAFNEFSLWITVVPLCFVAGGHHVFFCCGIYAHDLVEIGESSFANFHIFLHYFDNKVLLLYHTT